MLRFALPLMLFALPVAAQDLTLAQKMERGVIMDEDAFRAMVDGNTITYNDGTIDKYSEYYRPGTNRIVIQWAESVDPGQQTCDVGTWYAQDNTICFDWFTTGLVCAVWVDYHGEYISEIVRDGQRAGGLEVISTITQQPLYCEVGMVSLDLGNGDAG